MDNRIKIGFILLTCILLSIILINSILNFTNARSCETEFKIEPEEKRDTFLTGESLFYEFTGSNEADNNYLWTFEEGRTSKDPFPDYKYDTPGKKVVTLRLNDNCVYGDTIFVKYSNGKDPLPKRKTATEPPPKKETAYKKPRTKRKTRYKPAPKREIAYKPAPSREVVYQPSPIREVTNRPPPTRTIVQPPPPPKQNKTKPTSSNSNKQALTRTERDFTTNFTDESCVNYSQRSFEVVLRPSRRIRLKKFNLYSDKCGGVTIRIKHKSGEEQFEHTLNEGTSEIHVGFDEDFLEGEKYTLQFDATLSGSCEGDEVPNFGQLADCNVPARNDLINIESGKDYMFNIKFNY